MTTPTQHGPSLTLTLTPSPLHYLHPAPRTHLESRLGSLLSLLRAVTLAVVESFLALTAEHKLIHGRGLKSLILGDITINVCTHSKHVGFCRMCGCTSL